MTIRTFQSERHARNLAEAARRQRRPQDEAAELFWHLRRLADAIAEFYGGATVNHKAGPTAAPEHADKFPPK